MRILQVLHSLRRGGAERIAIEIARGLNESGEFVHICTLLDRNEYEKETDGLELSPLIQPSEYRWPWGVPRMAAALRQVIERVDPDIIQVHTPTAAVVVGWCRPKMPVQHVIHGYGTIARRPSFKARFIRRFAKWAHHRCCTQLVVVSESMRELTAKYFGVSGSQVACIHNGIDTDRFVFRRRTDNTHFRLLMVGTLGSVKRVDLGLKALAGLVRQINDVSLEIVGEGPLRDSLQQLIESYGLEKYAKLLGRREDVTALMAKADVFWHMSESEGLPLAVLEAMSTGLPVVGHDVRGMKDVVTDGKTGFLLQFEDVEGVITKTVELRNNPSLRFRMSQTARNYCVDTYSVRRMLSEYHESLIKLIQASISQKHNE